MEGSVGRQGQAQTVLQTLTGALLSCTSPIPLGGAKSDLHLWKEICTLFDDGSIFCPNRECSIVWNIEEIRRRYISFWSQVESNNYVLPQSLIVDILTPEKALPPFRESSSSRHVQVRHRVFARQYLYQSWGKRYSTFVLDGIYFISTSRPPIIYPRLLFHSYLVQQIAMCGFIQTVCHDPAPSPGLFMPNLPHHHLEARSSSFESNR